MTEQEFNELPMIMKVQDIQKILGISKNAAYELINQRKFPVLVLGERKIRIPKQSFISWIQANTQLYKAN